MKQINNFLIVIFLSFSCIHILYAADNELIFVSAPTHSDIETTKLYTPLVEFLSEKTGKKIKLELAKNFVQYSAKMQSGKYDIIFDGPHLAAWRMKRLQHTPIIRFPGQIKIVIVAPKDSKFSKLNDLQYGKNVCAFFPPNMLTMAFLSKFPNPAREPIIKRVQGFKNLIQCVKKGKGEAAVFRDKLWGKAKKTGLSKGLKIIARPPESYPERTFTTGPKVDAELRKKITKLLLSKEGRQAASAVLKRFKRKSFIKANPEEYTGLARLIKVIWGFQ